MSRKKSLVGLIFDLPEKIRKIRGDLSQAIFGKLIGVNQGTVHKYEKGISAPSRETLDKIAAYGGVTVGWLLHGKKDVVEIHGELAEPITIESPKFTSAIHSPYVFGAIDINVLTQIIEMVEELLGKRKKPLKPVRKALLISLLYDQFQTTSQPIDQATLIEFLRRVD